MFKWFTFDAKSLIPMLTRYFGIAVGSALASAAASGWFSTDLQAWLSNADTGKAITGLILTGLITIWGMMRKPSSKGLEVAKEVDAKVPASMPIEIKTPDGLPNIHVPGKA